MGKRERMGVRKIMLRICLDRLCRFRLEEVVVRGMLLRETQRERTVIEMEG